ncbi:flavin reductase family protein [Actinoallomurus purpureus]|uniref:flavin reductase family protein n=1 Tax=Actinoallomurus purpureus TaxID=478114 RepID=UPI0020929A5C|nr:flavin reductase family protein [Actinoallomurus purpureus]MCO6009966.1 flavin reductase family protein [Actinoallomurus purpureus]
MSDSTVLEPANAFRSTMGKLATGVSVITTRTADRPIGITVSSVASLSLDPLQVLVCVSNHLYTRTAIEEHGRFAVNILGEEGEYLARQFASSRPDKFTGVDIQEDHGVPVLRDAIAYLVCDVSDVLPGGDHTIFVGDVRHFEHIQDGRPLLFFAGAFHALPGAAAG